MSSFGNESSDAVSLNLVPMLDIFSIMITFLLMSFSTDPVSHDVRQGLELPQSRTIQALDEIPAVSVSRDQLLVNDKLISTIVGGDVPESDRSQGAIMPLYQELVKLKEANDKVKQSVGGKTSKLGTLTMEMDQTHRFKLLKRVMLSAQQAEFVTFKLMVKKEHL